MAKSPRSPFDQEPFDQEIDQEVVQEPAEARASSHSERPEASDGQQRLAELRTSILAEIERLIDKPYTPEVLRNQLINIAFKTFGMRLGGHPKRAGVHSVEVRNEQ